MSRTPHCLDSRLTDGGKVVSPTHRPRFTPHKAYFYVSGTDFCQRPSKPQGLVRPEGLGKFKKKNHFIGFRTRDFPVWSIQKYSLEYLKPRDNLAGRRVYSKNILWWLLWIYLDWFKWRNVWSAGCCGLCNGLACCIREGDREFSWAVLLAILHSVF
jgi:hypothetical protein